MMSKEKIESRRAFFKNAAKALGAVALAAPLFMSAQKSEAAQPDENTPPTQGCQGNCVFGCTGCSWSCTMFRANTP